MSLKTMVLGVTVLVALSAVACGSDKSGSGNKTQNGGNGQQSIARVDSNGNTSVDSGRLQTELQSLPAGSLSTEERDGLLFMREEEKLARDVYQSLAGVVNRPILNNISKSEQTHMDAMKALLDRFKLQDPAQAAGKFTNPQLQKLYDDLVARGKTSEVEALRAGALIEEIDIRDLNTREAQTDEPAIKLVYDNLKMGSRNHLRSFVSTLGTLGVTYAPTTLSQSDYAAIIAGGIES